MNEHDSSTRGNVQQNSNQTPPDGDPDPLAGFESDIDVEASTVPEHPVVVDVPGKGTASAVLMTQGEVEEKLDDDQERMSPREKLELLQERYHSPSFANVTVQDYKNSKAGYFEAFVQPLIDHPESYTPPGEGFGSEINLADGQTSDQPQVVEVDGQGEAAATLITQAEVDALLRDVGNMDDESKAQARLTEWFVQKLRDHYHQPSFDDLDVESYEASRPGYYQAFIDAIAPELKHVGGPGGGGMGNI